MSDYWVKEAERKGDEASDYGDWILANTEHIVEQYSCSDITFPEEIYECVLDDDYQDAEDSYIEDLDIDDVPDDFIQRMYEEYLEN